MGTPFQDPGLLTVHARGARFLTMNQLHEGIELMNGLTGSPPVPACLVEGYPVLVAHPRSLSTETCGRWPSLVDNDTHNRDPTVNSPICIARRGESAAEGETLNVLTEALTKLMAALS